MLSAPEDEEPHNLPIVSKEIDRSIISKCVRIFLQCAVIKENTVRGRTASKNDFSDRLNWEYDKSAFRKSAEKLFHRKTVPYSCSRNCKGPIPEHLGARWTVSVLVSAECRSLARGLVTC